MIQRLCPRCGQSFSGQMLCTQCGIQLVTPGGTNPTGAVDIRNMLDLSTGNPSFLWRLFLGVMIAQGLYYALRQFCIAFFLTNQEAERVWDEGQTLFLLKSIQAISLMIAGIIAGAAVPRAALLGLALGTINGGLIVGVEWYLEQFTEGWLFWMQPLFHAFMGLTGTIIGRTIWRPLPPLPDFLTPSSGKANKEVEVIQPPVKYNWARILIGVVFVFTGTVWAHSIRDFLIRFGGGRIGGFTQGQFINWELCALITVASSMFAGATTRAGLRHGLVVGILGSIALCIVQLRYQIVNYPSMDFWVEEFAFPPEADFPFRRLVLTISNTMLLSLAGGWLGGQLFPVTVRKSR